MKLVLALLIGAFLFAFAPSKAHAIIFLPATILIPIAKIVAIVIGGFSAPAIGIGALWSKLFKKSLKRTVLSVVIILLVIGLIVGGFLMIENPNRPIF